MTKQMIKSNKISDSLRLLAKLQGLDSMTKRIAIRTSLNAQIQRIEETAHFDDRFVETIVCDVDKKKVDFAKLYHDR